MRTCDASLAQHLKGSGELVRGFCLTGWEKVETCPFSLSGAKGKLAKSAKDPSLFPLSPSLLPSLPLFLASFLYLPSILFFLPLFFVENSGLYMKPPDL